VSSLLYAQQDRDTKWVAMEEKAKEAEQLGVVLLEKDEEL
jgi:hypothetical protein